MSIDYPRTLWLTWIGCRAWSLFDNRSLDPNAPMGAPASVAASGAAAHDDHSGAKSLASASASPSAQSSLSRASSSSPARTLSSGPPPEYSELPDADLPGREV